MNYYEVKTVRKEDRRYIKEIHLVKASELLSAYTTAGINLSDKQELEFLGVSRKEVVDVFTASGGVYFEVKIEFDGSDGKVIKETYIQQASELSNVKTLLLQKVSGTPEFKAIVEKGYEDYFVEEID